MTLDTLVLTPLAWIGFALAALYAGLTLVNLAIFRAPGPAGSGRPTPRVSILIPARDEADNIVAALDAALAQESAEVEVVVLDDGSTDDTVDRVRAVMRRDDRVRLEQGRPLPPGWNGKQHACHQLAEHARYPVLLFVDADVRLQPEAVARMDAYRQDRALDLVSGFPRQVTRTLAEIVAIPQILVVLLGYLPFPFARMTNVAGLAAGCGQLMLVTADAYAAAGGHAAFRDRMHDGLNLPRNVRLSGGRTDILDATPVASCRMYDNWDDIWSGFSKNATEGMAKPVALPVWTVLLGGGHILPWFLAILSWAFGAATAWTLSLWAIGMVLFARTVLAIKVRQHPLSVLLHPVGVWITLAIQYGALAAARKGGRATWRGRTYEVN
ncbi:glycosyltransferase family 2 protein [Jannaschia sp. LMIT008]|uniref:glycosyltransferase n=1 Tax=Jannaschia maritima TaxID=3032585 RepID=UPI0028112A2A|nr:glycosyltransferase family 2 protein [Jannaschia sp. LMIT008]